MAPITRPQPSLQEIAEAVKLYQAGTKIPTIVNHFGRRYSIDIWSRLLVPEYREKRAERINAMRRARSDAQSGWTEAKEAKLKELWANGESYSKIAEELGIKNRSAVAGKVFRLGLPKRDNSQRNRTIAIPRKRKRADGGKVISVQSRLFTPNVELPAAEIPQPSALMLELHQLGRNSCRWPVTGHDAKPNEHRFCGAHTSMRYCEYHARKSVRRKEAA